MTRMIVAGGREFTDKAFFMQKMDEMLAKYENIEIVSGHACGADSMAESYAKFHGLSLKIMPAEWKKFGSAAGSIRNKQMLDYAVENEPVWVAFWDGQSKGTKDMIFKAQKANVDVNIFMYSN